MIADSNFNQGFPPDFTAEDIAIIREVEPYTLTGLERLVALIKAVRYIVTHNIEGDFVECGVWRGGSIMAMARTLLHLNDRHRTLYLFDTFEGMPLPGPRDVDYRGEPATRLFDQIRCCASMDEVASAVYGVGYDPARIQFVRGRVEQTLPERAPENIALLRLDTDWYESTRHELIHLFPRLSSGGVLIVDDYGHWRGAREATDEYLAQQKVPLLLNRIDYTGRIGVKISQ
jgi:O-methyltransferase